MAFPATKCRAATGAGLLLVGWLALLLFCVPRSLAVQVWVFPVPSVPFVVYLGAVTAPAVLLAAWAVLGPLSLTTRFPIIGVLLLASPIASKFGFMLSGHEASTYPGTQMVMIFWSLTLCFILPFMLLRLTRGWRVRHASLSPERTPAHPPQFSLRAVLSWTALCSVLFSFLVFAFRREEWPATPDSFLAALPDFLTDVAITSVGMLPAIALLAACLGGRGKFKAFLGWLVLLAAVNVVLASPSPLSPFVYDIQTLALGQIGFYTNLTISLLVLRWSGFRLEPRSVAEAT